MTFDHLTLKVVSKSRVTWATSVPISVFLGLSVLELRPTYATDSHQTSEKASLRHRFLRDQTFLLKEITSFLLLRFSLNVNINNQNSIACRWLHHGLCGLFFQGSGIKVTSLKVILASWLQRCSVNKLQVECNRFLECYKRQKDITISQKWCILGTVTIEQLDRFLDHVLDRFLYELRSDLVIYLD